MERLDDRSRMSRDVYVRFCESLRGGSLATRLVCVFHYREDAQRFYRVLPKRLEKFSLEVAAEKTRLLRFSRFHLSIQRRFTFPGFELYWFKDRKGVARIMRRTARKKLQGA